MITRQLNPQAITLEDAQGEIKKTIKDAYLAGKSRRETERLVALIIAAAVKKLHTPALIDCAPRSLWAMARKVYSNFSTLDAETLKTVAKGVPMGQYPKTYMKQVNDTLRKIADIQALDADDVTGRNSLRNRAEMEVRYEYHQNEIADYKKQGTKLVICSTHADCSDRCYPWQGRVYSLDHTTGITADGKRYIPLETATDIYYTTKAGKTYKNGLLGFNCRHRLYEYKDGMQVPYVSAKEQKQEYAITVRQRQMETQIRHYREEYLIYHGTTDEALAQRARKKAIALNKRYIAFSQKNERAYYPDRVKII